MRNRFLVAVAACTSLWASDIAGPVSGYVYDAPAHAVRPVLGILGASTIGEPLDFGFGIRLAAISPAQDYALAVDTDGKVRLVRFGGDTALIDALHGAPQSIAISPRGSAAVLINADSFDVYTGLPFAPSLARTLKRTSDPAAVAVSDDGAAVLAVYADGLAVAGSSAEWKPVAGAEKAKYTAFAAGSGDAAVASADGQIALYRSVADGGDPIPLGSMENPVGVAFTPEGKVVAASAATHLVSIFDPLGITASLDCSCVATGVSPMGAAFRLNELGTTPLWLLQLNGAEARVVFVPAPRPDAQ